MLLLGKKKVYLDLSVLRGDISSSLEVPQGLVQVRVELDVGGGNVGVNICMVWGELQRFLERVDGGLEVAELEVADAHVVVCRRYFLMLMGERKRGIN